MGEEGFVYIGNAPFFKRYELLGRTYEADVNECGVSLWRIGPESHQYWLVSGPCAPEDLLGYEGCVHTVEGVADMIFRLERFRHTHLTTTKRDFASWLGWAWANQSRREFWDEVNMAKFESWTNDQADFIQELAEKLAKESR